MNPVGTETQTRWRVTFWDTDGEDFNERLSCESLDQARSNAEREMATGLFLRAEILKVVSTVYEITELIEKVGGEA